MANTRQKKQLPKGEVLVKFQPIPRKTKKDLENLSEEEQKILYEWESDQYTLTSEKGQK